MRAGSLNHSQGASDVLPIIRKLREAGQLYRQIADELNRRKPLHRSERQWSPVQVRRVWLRFVGRKAD